MKRRPISPFSLSFLDIMFCGFGAVVLLVLLLDHDTVKARNETFADLRAEVVRLEQEVLVGKENLVAARNSLEAVDEESVVTEGETEQVVRESRELEIEIARLENETLATREDVAQLSSDLETLEKDKKRLAAPAPDQRERGDKLRRVAGEGDRQYLTGLKLGGKRILILIDASASMLDETLVNVIRRRNMDDAQKRSAPKWRRALAIGEWLVANLPDATQFQLYTFDTRAVPTLASSRGRWLSTSERGDVDGAVAGLMQTIPGGGTSLHDAFAAAVEMTPNPDNILLVTDGLPTQGQAKPRSTTVSGKDRLAHFGRAAKLLPAGIPVNTILLPMEGDAHAAAAYWKLALQSRGSFLTPASDWP